MAVGNVYRWLMSEIYRIFSARLNGGACPDAFRHGEALFRIGWFLSGNTVIGIPIAISNSMPASMSSPSQPTLNPRRLFIGDCPAGAVEQCAPWRRMRFLRSAVSPRQTVLDLLEVCGLGWFRGSKRMLYSMRNGFDGQCIWTWSVCRSSG